MSDLVYSEKNVVMMVSVRDCLGVAVRAESDKNKVRGNQPVTGLNRIKGLGRCCTNTAPKTIIYSFKTKGRGVSCDGYPPQRAASHNRSHAQSD